MSTESATTPASDAGDGFVFEAPGRNELETLASGSWSASADALVNPGSSAVAEPWLVLSAVPSADLRGRGRDSCQRRPRFGLRSIVWSHRRLAGRRSGVRWWSHLSVCLGYGASPVDRRLRLGRWVQRRSRARGGRRSTPVTTGTRTGSSCAAMSCGSSSMAPTSSPERWRRRSTRRQRTRKPGSGHRAWSSKCGRCRFSCFPQPERIRRADARPRDPNAAR